MPQLTSTSIFRVSGTSIKKGLFIAASALLFSGFSNAQSITFGVTFGTPQEPGHGVCVGKGVCRESLDMDVTTGVYTSSPEAVTVTFQAIASSVATSNESSTTVNNAIMMSFSLSELTAKQPDAVSSFTTASGNYSFDAVYSMPPSIYGSLNLLPNPRISPNSPATVQIGGDFVTVVIYYDHD